MKWSQLYLYQCKTKVITNRGGDIQSIFSSLRELLLQKFKLLSGKVTLLGRKFSLL